MHTETKASASPTPPAKQRAAFLAKLAIAFVLAAYTGSCAVTASEPCLAPCLDSLDSLSITALQNRSYGAKPELLRQLGSAQGRSEYSRHYSSDGSAPYSTFLGSYISEGLRNYMRVDIPAVQMPPAGFPVVLFAHGWVGLENAQSYRFGYDTDSFAGKIVDGYVDAGFIVVTPGYRGHGAVDNRPAQGIEFVARWDNASYLMPSFYSIDVLNLFEGLGHLNETDWSKWILAGENKPRLDLNRIYLAGHSQGGDVALTALAIAGNNAKLSNRFAAASIWAGNIPDRFTQLETFGPMAESLQAFMSGDGTWTGSATGKDGSINPNFVFAWPADWIGTLDTQSDDWTWQKDTWATPTVTEAVRKRYRTMYTTLNNFVQDIEDAEFNMTIDTSGKYLVVHPEKIAAQMNNIGGFFAAEHLTQPLFLHTSDRDYYSIPTWNTDLANRVNSAGGNATAYIYPGNTHSFTRSKHSWFSPPGTEDGFGKALKRDLALFKNYSYN